MYSTTDLDSHMEEKSYLLELETSMISILENITHESSINDISSVADQQELILDSSICEISIESFKALADYLYDKSINSTS